MKKVNKFQKKSNIIRDFFSAIDEKLEGNKIYDWYWYHVWRPIWRMCYFIPSEKLQQRKFNRQRVAYGVSDQDCWSIPDWLLETMYYALEKFLRGEYGEEPIDWKEHICETHDKKLYKQITEFRSEYERLQNIRARVEKFDSGTDPVEVWYPEYHDLMNREYDAYSNCINLLTKLLSKHLENLWW